MITTVIIMTFNIIVQNAAMNADQLEMRVAVPFETAMSEAAGDELN